MATTTTNTDDLEQMLIEGYQRDGEWFASATTDLDDYDKLNDELYYNSEDDEYIVILSFSDIDSILEDSEDEAADMESIELGYLEYYRDQYNISTDYNTPEFVRRHICSKNGFSRDLYTNYGVGRLYLRRG